MKVCMYMRARARVCNSTMVFITCLNIITRGEFSQRLLGQPGPGLGTQRCTEATKIHFTMIWLPSGWEDRVGGAQGKVNKNSCRQDMYLSSQDNFLHFFLSVRDS